MFERPLRAAAILVSLVIAASFVLFAIDESRDASSRAQAQIAGTAGQERARERAHGRVREAIDDANDVLLEPFAGVSDGSSSRWLRRGVPTVLGLLVFGLGGGFLARFARGRP